MFFVISLEQLSPTPLSTGYILVLRGEAELKSSVYLNKKVY